MYHQVSHNPGFHELWTFLGRSSWLMFWFLSADSWFAGIVWCFKLPCLCDACTAWVVGEHPVLGSQSLACVGEQPLWAVCVNVQPPTQQGNFFASIWMEFPVFQFVPVTSCPFTGHSREELQLLSLPYQVFIPFGEITLSCICSRLNISHILLLYQIHQSLNHLHWVPVSYTGPAQSPAVSHWCWVEEENQLPRPSSSSGLCWLLFKVFCVSRQQVSRSFCKAAFQPVKPAMCWCLGLFLAKYRTRHFLLLQAVRCLWAHFSCLLRSLSVHFLASLSLEYILKDMGMRDLASVSWAVKCPALFCSVLMTLCSF